MGLRNFLWLICLAALWGPSFLFIKVAVGEIPPFTLVAGRVGVAATLLYIILRLQGRNLPRFGRIWGHFVVVGFFSNALPFTLFSWGEIYIDSALADIFVDIFQGTLYLNAANVNTDIQDMGFTYPIEWNGTVIAFDDITYAPDDGWSDLGYMEILEPDETDNQPITQKS